MKLKSWYLIHKWSSLVSTIFLLMLCVTGLPLIFSHEIDHLIGNSVEPPEIDEPGLRANLDKIVSDAQRRKPNDVIQFLVGDFNEPELWHLRLGENLTTAEASAFFTYDARTGKFLNDYPLDEGFMNLMLRLHVDMYAGLPGTLFLGFMGLLLIVALISGVVLYAPFMSKLKFGTIRRNKSRLITWLDIHNLFGIVTLAWLCVVTATGVINTLSIPIFSLWQTTQLEEMIAEYKDEKIVADYSVEKAVRNVLEENPTNFISFMAFPGTNFSSPKHFVAFLQGKSAWTSKLLTPVLIDAKTGEILEQRELPLYVSILLLSQPLHYGDYGELPLKIIWFILDLIAIIVLISGIYLWLKVRDQSYDAWYKKMLNYS